MCSTHGHHARTHERRFVHALLDGSSRALNEECAAETSRPLQCTQTSQQPQVKGASFTCCWMAAAGRSLKLVAPK